VNEIELKADVQKEVADREWCCSWCKATKRADVYTGSELKDNERVAKVLADSTLIVIVCRACGHESPRYYAIA
jgi:hypothetical protein